LFGKPLNNAGLQREYPKQMTRRLYQALAGLVEARLNCMASDNNELLHHCEEQANDLVRECMPNGGRFHSTRLDWNRSMPNKLVLVTGYRHTGHDAGWTKHTVTVRPDLCLGFKLSISRSNRHDFKEFIAEFGAALDQNEPEEAAI
jgi:hypothetical protein